MSIEDAIRVVEHRVAETLPPEPPHEHEWEDAYVLERLFGDAPGPAHVVWCLPCGAIKGEDGA